METKPKTEETETRIFLRIVVLVSLAGVSVVYLLPYPVGIPFFFACLFLNCSIGVMWRIVVSVKNEENIPQHWTLSLLGSLGLMLVSVVAFVENIYHVMQ